MVFKTYLNTAKALKLIWQATETTEIQLFPANRKFWREKFCSSLAIPTGKRCHGCLEGSLPSASTSSEPFDIQPCKLSPVGRRWAEGRGEARGSGGEGGGDRQGPLCARPRPRSVSQLPRLGLARQRVLPGSVWQLKGNDYVSKHTLKSQSQTNALLLQSFFPLPYLYMRKVGGRGEMGGVWGEAGGGKRAMGAVFSWAVSDLLMAFSGFVYSRVSYYILIYMCIFAWRTYNSFPTAVSHHLPPHPLFHAYCYNRRLLSKCPKYLNTETIDRILVTDDSCLGNGELALGLGTDLFKIAKPSGHWLHHHLQTSQARLAHAEEEGGNKRHSYTSERKPNAVCVRMAYSVHNKSGDCRTNMTILPLLAAAHLLNAYYCVCRSTSYVAHVLVVVPLWFQAFMKW